MRTLVFLWEMIYNIGREKQTAKKEDPMLRLENITYSVPQANGEREKILDNVTLDIPDGRYVVITGPNGGGKTTLARVIMGIVTPDSGRIKFDGMDITPLDVTQRAEAGISYAFQQPPRFKGLTVRDLLQVAANKKLTRDACCDYLKGGTVCQRLPEPRGGHFPVRRRGQADRDRDHSREKRAGHDLR